MFYILLFSVICITAQSLQCGSYISPCISHINKMYQLIGPSNGPMEKLVTNLNFYAADACIGVSHSFVTTATLRKESNDNHCEEGFDSYSINYSELSFVIHNLTYFSYFNIQCNKEIKEGHIYNILNDELDCKQEGTSFFNSYKKHIPSIEKKCFQVNEIDFYSSKGGTRNIRLSDSGCTDLNTSDDFEEEISEL